MKQKKIAIDHAPEQPQVYIVVHHNLQPNLIGDVFTDKNDALEDAGSDVGWIVITRNLEVTDA